MDELEGIKRRAALKLEADLHAYIDVLSAAGVEEREAAALAREALRAAFARVPEQRRPRRNREG